MDYNKKEAEASLFGNPLGLVPALPPEPQAKLRLCRLSTYWSAKNLG